MIENYIEKYMDINGKVTIRSITRRIRMIFFAGTKFLFDRLLAIIGLIVLFPLMLVISIIIKIDSKGPVLFKQVRTGKKGKNFTMYKFRTMSVNNDVHDFSKEDQHTRFGKILRKTSLDELPQLISIAAGKMSFIGPRPWIPDYYDNMNDIQRNRYVVRPGLTGLAQVNGRNFVKWDQRLAYDVEYVKNITFIGDLKIFMKAIGKVFSHSDVAENPDDIDEGYLDEIRGVNRGE